MTHLFLVRHAETVWHRENRYAGRADIALSPRGCEQAEQLSSWASSARLEAIWVSPLLRARQTAAPSEHATGLTAVVDSRLEEVGYGQAEGLTRAEMQQRFPEALAAFEADPIAHPLPGAENPHGAVERAIACFRDIAAKHSNGRVLVVTHKTLIRVALCALIGVPLSRFRDIFPLIGNTTLTEICLHDGAAALLRLNVPVSSSSGAESTEDEP
jgi:broad specificity phosphatase PhoE